MLPWPCVHIYIIYIYIYVCVCVRVCVCLFTQGVCNTCINITVLYYCLSIVLIFHLSFICRFKFLEVPNLSFNFLIVFLQASRYSNSNYLRSADVARGLRDIADPSQRFVTCVSINT